jgi:FkbM family methyltransferase
MNSGSASSGLSLRGEALRAVAWLALGLLLSTAWLRSAGGGTCVAVQLHPTAPGCTAAAAAALAAAADSAPPRNVYFDLGANNGQSITQFLDAHPLRAGEAWDVVLIEATPRFTAELLLLCDSLVASARARSCLPIVETALTTANGHVSVFVEEQRGESDASTIVADSKIVGGAGAYFNASALDVVSLFREVFPVRPEDFVAVKVDIEGAEFAVVQRAVLHGLVPLWDVLDVEWHDENPLIYGSQERERYRELHKCLKRVIEGEGLRIGEWGR